MKDVVDYLMKNYYPKYKGTRTDIVPDPKTLEFGLTRHMDKVVIVRDDTIRGVAIFVTISDTTFKLLKSFDITQLDILLRLLNEHGPNVHFVLLCADGKKTILRGIKNIMNTLHPKTISWWNPDLTKLHVRRF